MTLHTCTRCGRAKESIKCEPCLAELRAPKVKPPTVAVVVDCGTCGRAMSFGVRDANGRRHRPEGVLSRSSSTECSGCHTREVRPAGMRTQEVAEEYAFLKSFDETDENIAARLGIKVDSLRRTLTRAERRAA